MPMVPTDSGQDMAQVDRLDSFMGSGTAGTHSSPVDTDPSLSSAADPIPSAYLSSTPTQVHIISPDSCITGIAPENTVQGIDASQLTVQPIGSLTAGSLITLSGSLLETNDPNFSLQFLNLSAVPDRRYSTRTTRNKGSIQLSSCL